MFQATHGSQFYWWRNLMYKNVHVLRENKKKPATSY